MRDYTATELSFYVREYIHSDRDRHIVWDRLYNGMTYEQLAEKHNLSVSQVKRIVYRSEKVLFRHLN